MGCLSGETETDPSDSAAERDYFVSEWVRASRTAQDAAEDEFSVSGALMLLFGAQTGRLWSQELPFFLLYLPNLFHSHFFTFIEIDEHISRHRSLIYCTFMIYKTDVLI